jgi:hypothetical protein
MRWPTVRDQLEAAMYFREVGISGVPAVLDELLGPMLEPLRRNSGRSTQID